MSERARVKVAVHQSIGRLGDEDAAPVGGLLEPCRNIRRIAHRRVVHAQVAADASDDDQAGVEPLTDMEIDSRPPLELGPVAF